MLLNQLGELLHLQRRRVVNEVQPEDDRIPKRDRAAETMEQWQAAENAVGVSQVQPRAELDHIAHQIAMREHHALRIARAAAGEEQSGFLVSALTADAENHRQQ